MAGGEPKDNFPFILVAPGHRSPRLRTSERSPFLLPRRGLGENVFEQGFHSETEPPRQQEPQDTGAEGEENENRSQVPPRTMGCCHFTPPSNRGLVRPPIVPRIALKPLPMARMQPANLARTSRLIESSKSPCPPDYLHLPSFGGN
eukprot:CAMPEP_0183298684 /NCGR_PEP_ID=MMETSP0160_2-20130417/5641_1 /TAXON_ID=2839 ORGANISM="Odontella Sinensis, Strain Grunow 1884" /NCGR_SAMPLE_ID=MMETSP0160_2 /ASSEMBLY_ACC=CAM_ASM_000250 /LENGTH=145 /DNA_ID=CAMNT_0025460783 /DNA_START=42 /DNA_END=479 /DNA_ORIENTATION=+